MPFFSPPPPRFFRDVEKHIFIRNVHNRVASREMKIQRCGYILLLASCVDRTRGERSRSGNDAIIFREEAAEEEPRSSANKSLTLAVTSTMRVSLVYPTCVSRANPFF